MIKAAIYDDEMLELYSAEFADFTDAAKWIDGVMKADDTASHVFTENVDSAIVDRDVNQKGRA